MRKAFLVLLLLPHLLLFCSCEEEINYENVCESITTEYTDAGFKISVIAQSVDKVTKPSKFEFYGKSADEAFGAMLDSLDKTIFKSCEYLNLSQINDEEKMRDILTYIANESRLQINCTTDKGLSFIEFYRKFFAESKDGI